MIDMHARPTGMTNFHRGCCLAIGSAEAADSVELAQSGGGMADASGPACRSLAPPVVTRHVISTQAKIGAARCGGPAFQSI
jgi:hypothetical protein